MRKILLCTILISLFLLTATFSAMAEGLSHLSKNTIIKRTNPDFQDFIRQYLNVSDSYSNKECLDYGLRTNARKECLQYCELYFRENHGLTPLAASFLRATALGMEYSVELRTVLYNFLISGKEYGIQSCNQAWQAWLSIKYTEVRIRNLAHKQAEDMCQKFFQP